MRALIEGTKRLSFDEITKIMADAVKGVNNPEETRGVIQEQQMEESSDNSTGSDDGKVKEQYYWEYYEEQ